MKTNKSYSKRLRVTKKGKILGRKPGQNHFSAKKSGEKHISRKRSAIFVMKNRAKARFLAGA